MTENWVVWFNGEIIPETEARVPFRDRPGSPPRLTLHATPHWERLRTGLGAGSGVAEPQKTEVPACPKR